MSVSADPLQEDSHAGEMVLSRDAARGDATRADAAVPQGAIVTERILFVSDDEQLRVLLSELLVAHGCPVLALDSLTALASSNRFANCDVAIVDTSVSYANAVRALRKLKKAGEAAIVVIAEAGYGASDADLATNGDVVLAKPFDPRELVFIVRGMLHRFARGAPQSREPLSVGPVTLHALLNTATVAAREIELTGVETRVLGELLASPSYPVTRDRLSRRALGREWSPFDRCLDTHINRLRRKIGDDWRGRTPIRTIRGVGYLLLADWEPRR